MKKVCSNCNKKGHSIETSWQNKLDRQGNDQVQHVPQHVPAPSVPPALPMSVPQIPTESYVPPVQTQSYVPQIQTQSYIPYVPHVSSYIPGPYMFLQP